MLPGSWRVNLLHSSRYPTSTDVLYTCVLFQYPSAVLKAHKRKPTGASIFSAWLRSVEKDRNRSPKLREVRP